MEETGAKRKIRSNSLVSSFEFRKIIRVGNSFCVTLPVKYLTHLDLKPFDYVVMRLTDNKIEVKKCREFPEPKKK